MTSPHLPIDLIYRPVPLDRTLFGEVLGHPGAGSGQVDGRTAGYIRATVYMLSGGGLNRSLLGSPLGVRTPPEVWRLHGIYGTGGDLMSWI